MAWLPPRAAWRNAGGRVRFLDALDLLGVAIDETAAHALDPARRGLPRLSAPTEHPAHVDPIVLARRALAHAGRGVEPAPRDAEVALLRLAPTDARWDEARAIAASVSGAFGGALRYALGLTETPPAELALRLAASRARDPQADDPNLASDHALGAGGGLAARHTWHMAREQADRFSYPGVAFRRIPPPAPSASPPTPLVLALHRGQVASTFGRISSPMASSAGGTWAGSATSRCCGLASSTSSSSRVRRLLTGNLEFGSRLPGPSCVCRAAAVADDPARRGGARPASRWPSPRRSPTSRASQWRPSPRAAGDGRLDPAALGAVMARMCPHRRDPPRAVGQEPRCDRAHLPGSSRRRGALPGAHAVRRSGGWRRRARRSPARSREAPRAAVRAPERVRSEPLPEATCMYLRALPDTGRLAKLKRSLLGEPPATRRHPG